MADFIDRDMSEIIALQTSDIPDSVSDIPSDFESDGNSLAPDGWKAAYAARQVAYVHTGSVLRLTLGEALNRLDWGLVPNDPDHPLRAEMLKASRIMAGELLCGRLGSRVRWLEATAELPPEQKSTYVDYLDKNIRHGRILIAMLTTDFGLWDLNGLHRLFRRDTPDTRRAVVRTKDYDRTRYRQDKFDLTNPTVIEYDYGEYLVAMEAVDCALIHWKNGKYGRRIPQFALDILHMDLDNFGMECTIDMHFTLRPSYMETAGDNRTPDEILSCASREFMSQPLHASLFERVVMYRQENMSSMGKSTWADLQNYYDARPFRPGYAVKPWVVLRSPGCPEVILDLFSALEADVDLYYAAAMSLRQPF